METAKQNTQQNIEENDALKQFMGCLLYTSIPQEQLDAILRSGGGRDNSRKRIYAKYCQGKTPEELSLIHI